MSKEYLEALERLKENSYYVNDRNMQEDYNTIKQALLELKAIKDSNPSEALECLEYIEYKLDGLRVECERHHNHRCDDLFIQEHVFTTIKQTLLKTQEQEKVLKIIKEKNVDIHWIKKCETLNDYNNTLNSWEFALTQEEFELVKRYTDGKSI